ncbi:MAG TPA: TIGR01777 family oxidoreductase [Polyangiaceae bacterium]
MPGARKRARRNACVFLSLPAKILQNAGASTWKGGRAVVQRRVSGRIVVSGGTGYVGRGLVPRLAGAGREVVVLTRSGRLPPGLAQLPGVSALAWDASPPEAILKVVDGSEAVVHLAGEQAVGVRFTDARKKRILDSRVKSAEALVAAIEKSTVRPGVLVSASGVGYYGAHPPNEACDETTPPGDDFLARVCVEWEAAARGAERLGVRVAIARLAPVLGPGDGALSQMAMPFRWFVGGPLGDGQQAFAWVHLEDAVAALERCVVDRELSGPVNVVAPNVVTQREMARAIGRALHRPAWLPAPSFALKLLFGEGATPMLTGQRAVPKRLEERGFRFLHPQVDDALAASLG